MSLLSLWDVEFEVVKKSAGGQGPTYAYRKGVRRAVVSAASAHPKDILAVLTSDISGVLAGEVIEILSVRSGPVSGTEDGAVLA